MPVAARRASSKLSERAAILSRPSVSGQQWVMPAADERLAEAIAQHHSLDPHLARILAARDVSLDAVPAFLAPSLRSDMPDPSCLRDAEAAATRIADAISGGETIGIFGDYDVDGVTASVLLANYLEKLGQAPCVYLPDRALDGYGPSEKAFRTLKEQGASLIVTVDCGASAHEPIASARRDGQDVVVIDHHLMLAPPPQGALAVVNPNRPDDLSGLGNLSAVGVSFMVLVAVNRCLRAHGFFVDRPQPDLRQWLDLVALGLCCDVMPVRGLTRTMIAQGLKVLGAGIESGRTGNAGLAALARRAGVRLPVSPYHLGFLLGPRINAAGRVGHANMAFKLLTSSDPGERHRLAERLHILNAERQAIEADVLAAAQWQAEQQIETDPDCPVLVCAGQGWHPGVVGIVAGRIKDRFTRPALVIGLENETGKGSGRSISGVDLGSAISALKEDGTLISGGGHAMAAGLTVAESRLSALRPALSAMLSADVADARANRALRVDGVVDPLAITADFAEMIARAGPYGCENPEPVFMLRDLEIGDLRCVGDRHLAFTARPRVGDPVRAIAFQVMDGPLEAALRSGKRLHLAGRIKADDWRGNGTGQLQISDIAFAEDPRTVD